MQDNNQNSSLEIVEPENQINFSSGSSQIRDSIPQQDQLDYSRDEPSLSFVIEQQHRRSAEKVQSVPISNEPPKRKRRQIFEKYKQIAAKKPEQRQLLFELNQDDDVLRTFDQVFKINTPRDNNKNTLCDNKNTLCDNNKNTLCDNKNTETKYQLKNNSQTKQSIINNFKQQPHAFSKKDTKICQQNSVYKKKLVMNQQTSQQMVLARNLTTKESTQNMNNYTPPSNKNNIKTQNLSPIIDREADFCFNSSAFFDTPFTQTPQKNTYPHDDFDDQLNNFSDIQNRLSYIDGRGNFSMSRDAQQLANILNTQIFTDQKDKKKYPAIIPQQIQIQSKAQMSNIYKEGLQQNKSTLTYQKIDLSSSIASSVMMRDSRFTMKQFPESHNNLLGIKQPIEMKKRALISQNIFESREPLTITKIDNKKIRQSLCQESRIPVFLRKIREMNQIYPNFDCVNLTTSNFLEQQNHFLQELVSNVKLVLHLLESALNQIQTYTSYKNQLYLLIQKGITVSQFMGFNWVKLDQMKIILQQLRPRQRYQNRKWDHSKARKALQNYNKIVDYYHGIKLNLKDERGRTKYFDIRKKFWDVQRNIKMISEDVYTFALFNQHPQHYHEYYQILKQCSQKNYIFAHCDNIPQKMMLLQKVIRFKEKKQNLSNSEVGDQVIRLLKNIGKFNSAC